MRRIAGIMAVILVFTAVLAGCGKKDAGSVVKALDRKMESMESYQAAGTMVLHTGIDPQSYQVEVWYKKPNYYRISLTNEKKDVTQIVLRNDDGVFVLTPHLNKSFRFQSDWPDKQGQVYLFQSLVNSITEDKDRKFTTDGNAYVFDVAGNYQNASLARQKVWLSQKDYAPKHIEVSDASGNTMVVFDFTEFTFDKAFDKDSFDMQRNMTSSAISTMPTVGQVQGSGKDATSGKTTQNGASANSSGKAAQNGAAAGKSAQGTTGSTGTAGSAGTTGTTGTTGTNSTSAKTPAQSSSQETFGVIDPSYTPKGVKQQAVGDVNLGDSKGVMLRYSGTYTYTLLESRPSDQGAAAMQGEMVDLGYTMALLAGADKNQTMIWTYDGIEYRLTTDNLPKEEMVKVAQSVQAQIGK